MLLRFILRGRCKHLEPVAFVFARLDLQSQRVMCFARWKKTKKSLHEKDVMIEGARVVR